MTSLNSNFLTVNRIDVIFKYLFLKLKDKSPQFANKIYYDHIKIITNGLFKEKDNFKSSYEDFLNGFLKLDENIKKQGFNSEISRIPLSIDGSIINGAHRLASSLYHGVKVDTCNTGNKSHNYNYEFFKVRGLQDHILEYGILNYLELTKNNHLAIIWPSANKKIKYLDFFQEIIFDKKIQLNSNGAQNFVAQVYKDQKWIGGFKEGYSGAITKVAEAFNNFDEIHFIFFKSDSLKEANLIKNELRKLFKIGKASIHITDTDKETIGLGKLILNPNSEEFLNNSKPYMYDTLFNKLFELKENIKENGYSLNDFALTSSSVLGIYGYREPNDIDYLSFTELNSSNIYQSHNKLIDKYSDNLDQLIYNPKNYFYYNDFKFLSIDQIKNFKKSKNEIKDKLDLQLIKKRESFNSKLLYLKTLNLLQKVKFKTIAFLIPFSKKYGFYNFAKLVYKKLSQ